VIAFKRNNTKYCINPDNVLYLRENIGGVTYIAFNILDQNTGEPHFLLVDGAIDETEKKFAAEAKRAAVKKAD
jgi:hypothetical protein